MNSHPKCGPSAAGRQPQKFRAGNATVASLMLVAGLLLVGCASDAVLQQAASLEREGKGEQSLAQLHSAVMADPGNAQLRIAEQTLKERLVLQGLAEAKHFEQVSDASGATSAYQRVLSLEPGNPQAQAGISALQRQQQHLSLLQQAHEYAKKGRRDDAMTLLREILAEDPGNGQARELSEAIEVESHRQETSEKLAPALNARVSLAFKEATLTQVFEILSQTSGLNFVFDKDLKTSQKTTIFVKDTTVKQALDVLLVTNQLEQRVIGDNVILIYPNTPAKLKDYQDLRVRTFFLANGDVEAVANTLKTILKTRDLTVDKQRSMIVMRDTPDAIRMAERLVALHDLPEPEAMLEVEILEVNRDLLTTLGVQPPGQLSLSVLPNATSGSLTLQDLLHPTKQGIGVTVSPLTINATGTDSDIKTLANPRIRVKNRETAKILIGDRVPNITTTSTSTGFVADSVQYLDVGLKLEIVPVISVDGEVSIKIGLEVSSIANQITTNSGTTAYQITTRTASTVLRLKDNENQILAGLINDADRKTATGFPGLSRIPIAGRLFGSTDSEKSRSEIVLSITPHIVRNQTRQSMALLDFDSGTESDLRESSLSAEGSPAAANSQAAPVNPNGISPSAAQAATSPISSSTGASSAPVSTSSTAAAPGVAADAGQYINTTSGSTSSPLTWQGLATAKTGDTFVVQLAATPSQAVTSLGYQIDFDPTKLAVIGVTEGDFLPQGGTATKFTSSVDAVQGHVVISDARTATADLGTTAAGTAATLTLRALSATGTTQLLIEKLMILGPNATPVNASPPAPFTITVTP